MPSLRSLLAPSDRGCITILFALGLATRFIALNYPREVVWDEYHFGKFVNGYLTGEYFFDIHPPFGKLVLAFGAWIGGYKGEQGWLKIGEPIPASVNLFALRAVPALQGALLPLLLFVAGRCLGFSRPAALLAPAGALFDIVCLVEQRLVLVDATLLIGIALQLTAGFASDYHASLSGGWLRRVALEGAGIAIAGCTKMTGFATLAVAGVHSLLCLHRGHTRGAKLTPLIKEAAARAVLLLVVPALFYVLNSAVHLWLLPLTGPGAKFHNAAFRSTLKGDAAAISGITNAAAVAAAANVPGLWARIVEMNKEMVKVNAAIKKGHTWGSRWWEWPLARRSILYWTGHEPPYISPSIGLDRARIYAIGNPAVWWLAALAPTIFVAWAMSRWLGPGFSPAPKRASGKGEAAAKAESAATDASSGPGPFGRWTNGCLLMVGYLCNWLPFMLVDRVAFLYHFLPSLLHALLLAGLLVDLAVAPTALLAMREADDPRLADCVEPSVGTSADGARHPEGKRWLVVGVVVYLFATCFAFFAPLAYGAPLSVHNFEARMWLPSWH